ncbi:hypothetical protein AVEN_91106-1 [Araneus ventricosus]|uniref:Uncharacterized protein n=1 Tax=Araneus ventricosus TaxID=182803 RepID=A0A4Y2JEV5_ARAVE|nr:hypothetical protein AVEN_91106-1 [Araneus ventricosus]
MIKPSLIPTQSFGYTSFHHSPDSLPNDKSSSYDAKLHIRQSITSPIVVSISFRLYDDAKLRLYVVSLHSPDSCKIDKALRLFGRKAQVILRFHHSPDSL